MMKLPVFVVFLDWIFRVWLPSRRYSVALWKAAASLCSSSFTASLLGEIFHQSLCTLHSKQQEENKKHPNVVPTNVYCHDLEEFSVPSNEKCLFSVCWCLGTTACGCGFLSSLSALKTAARRAPTSLCRLQTTTRTVTRSRPQVSFCFDFNSRTENQDRKWTKVTFESFSAQLLTKFDQKWRKWSCRSLFMNESSDHLHLM